jgi:predicted nucleotidyltransferase
MSDPSGLSEKTIAAVRGVFARHPEIDEAILFGSRAKGTYRAGSDIDLALRGAKLDQRTLGRISGELDDLPIPYSFSLVVADERLEPALQAHLDRVGVMFYAKHLAPAPKT